MLRVCTQSIDLEYPNGNRYHEGRMSVHALGPIKLLSTISKARCTPPVYVMPPGLFPRICSPDLGHSYQSMGKYSCPVSIYTPESQLALLLWSFRPIAEVLDNPRLKFALSGFVYYQSLTPWDY